MFAWGVYPRVRSVPHVYISGKAREYLWVVFGVPAAASNPAVAVFGASAAAANPRFVAAEVMVLAECPVCHGQWHVTEPDTTYRASGAQASETSRCYRSRAGSLWLGRLAVAIRDW